MRIAEKIFDLALEKNFRAYIFLRSAEMWIYEKKLSLRWKLHNMKNPLRRKSGLFSNRGVNRKGKLTLGQLFGAD